MCRDYYATGALLSYCDHGIKDIKNCCRTSEIFPRALDDLIGPIILEIECTAYASSSGMPERMMFCTSHTRRLGNEDGCSKAQSARQCEASRCAALLS